VAAPKAIVDLLDRHKLGFEAVREKQEISRQLIETTDLRGSDLFFAIEAEYVRRHANDETYKEKCEKRNAAMPKAPPDFTQEELAHMIDVFEDANHPLSRSIAKKARRRIK
jgi:hypothetical protein